MKRSNCCELKLLFCVQFCFQVKRVICSQLMWFTMVFFFNLTGEVEYISSSCYSFDNFTGDTWSMSSVNAILNVLGLDRGDGKLSVYWLMLGKSFSDGLMLVEKQADIRLMVNAIKHNKTLVLFVDHGGFLKNLRPDVPVRPHGPASPSAHVQTPAVDAHRPQVNVEIPAAHVHRPAAGSAKQRQRRENDQSSSTSSTSVIRPGNEREEENESD